MSPKSRSLTSWSLTRAGLRDHLGLPLVTAAVVLVLAAVVVGWPRLVAQGATEQARYDVGATSSVQRDLVASASAPLPIGPASDGPEPTRAVQDAWGGTVQALADERAAMPEPLRSTTAPARFTVQVDPTEVGTASGSDVRTARLAITLDPYLAASAHVVDGTWPAPSDWDGVEVALAAPSAERLGWAVGEERSLVDPEGGETTVLLTGTFDADDPQDPDWAQRPYSIAPQEVDDLNTGVGVLAAAYAEPGSTALLGIAGERNEVIGFVDGALQTRPVPVQVAVPATSRVWYPVRAAAVDGSTVDDLLAQVRAFTATSIAIPGDPAVPDAENGAQVASTLTFSTGLTGTLERVDAQLAGAATVLAVVALGPLVAGGAVLVLAARLTASRRSGETTLLVARGASRARVRRLAAAGTAVLVVPAALVGAVVALLLTPGSVGLTGGVPAVVVALVAVLLAPLVVGSGGTGRRDLGRSGGRARAAVDAAVVVLALLGVAACLRGAGTSGTDPLVVAAPVLCVVASTLVALRLYPWVVRAIGRRAHRARGLAAFLGTSRAVRGPAGGFWPALALVLGLAVAVFSAGVSATLGGGVAAQGWVTVGADVRVSGPVVDDDAAAALAQVDDVTGVARVADLGSLVLRGVTSGERASTLAVETGAVRQVQADVPDAVTVPASLAEPVDGRLPVLVPSALGVAPGTDGLRLTAEQGADVEVVGYSDGLTGLRTGRATVVVDLALAEQMLDVTTRPRLVLVSTSSGADVARVADDVRDVVPASLVETHDDATSAILDAPIGAGLARAFVAASALAVLLGVLAVVLAQVAAAPGRSRLAAVLGALGSGRGELRRTVAWETWPWVLVAALVGVGTGAATPRLVVAAVDLTPFTGGTVQPAAALDTAVVVLAVVGAALLVPIAAVVGAAVSSRRSPAEVLRTTADTTQEQT